VNAQNWGFEFGVDVDVDVDVGVDVDVDVGDALFNFVTKTRLDLFLNMSAINVSIILVLHTPI